MSTVSVGVDAGVFVHWKSPTQAASLLLLFMQQPWAVAGCTKIPGDQQTRPQPSSSEIILLNRCGVIVLGDVFNFALRFDPQFGRTITLLCRVGVFTAWTKDWME